MNEAETMYRAILLAGTFIGMGFIGYMIAKAKYYHYKFDNDDLKRELDRYKNISKDFEYIKQRIKEIANLGIME